MDTNCRNLTVVSQNLLKYDVELSRDVVLRVNLAWHEDISNVYPLLEKYSGYNVFLDVPTGRRKPPNFDHNVNDVKALVAYFVNIEYVAVSNVENSSRVGYYQTMFDSVKIVPKIESFIGVRNARDIIEELNYDDKVVMLDHQDLYSDLLRMHKEDDYLELVAGLQITCRKLDTCLLRTVGVVFASMYPGDHA